MSSCWCYNVIKRNTVPISLSRAGCCFNVRRPSAVSLSALESCLRSAGRSTKQFVQAEKLCPEPREISRWGLNWQWWTLAKTSQCHMSGRKYLTRALKMTQTAYGIGQALSWGFSEGLGIACSHISLCHPPAIICLMFISKIVSQQSLNSVPLFNWSSANYQVFPSMIHQSY